MNVVTIDVSCSTSREEKCVFRDIVTTTFPIYHYDFVAGAKYLLSSLKIPLLLDRLHFSLFFLSR